MVSYWLVGSWLFEVRFIVSLFSNGLRLGIWWLIVGWLLLGCLIGGFVGWLFD